MAAARFGAGRLRDALTAAQCAVTSAPRDAGALRLFGEIALALGQRDRAVEALGSAFALDPNHVRGAQLLCMAYEQRRDYAAALNVADRLAADHPADADTQAARGAALVGLGRLDDAFAAFDAALASDPDHPHALVGRGVVRERSGEYIAALRDFERAIERQPDFADALTNRALTLIRLGRLRDGYRDYHAMMLTPARTHQYRYARSGKPRWTGEPLGGRRLLLAQEQGHGDMIQMLRFVPLLDGLEGSLALEIKAPLERLVARSFPDIRLVVDRGTIADVNGFDVHLPMMQLPAVLGVDIDTIPAAAPYLAPDAARVAALRASFAGDERRTVGIAWRGNPEHSGDSRRSTTLADWAPLAQVPGLRFVSLQFDAAAAELAAAPFPLAPPPRAIADFDDAAALAAAVDAVVTVDTVTAHLAGALARPGYVALPRDADYRWMLDRDDTPWYPSLRLVRQTVAGDWEPVFTEIANALHTLAAETEASRFVPK
jgi:Flp pilus assembly protein TadD